MAMKWQKLICRHIGLHYRASLAVTDRAGPALSRAISRRTTSRRTTFTPSPELSVNQRVTGDVARTVLEEQKADDTFLIQCNPADLQLTAEFIRQGVRHVLITKESKEKVENLQTELSTDTWKTLLSEHGSEVSLEVNKMSRWPISIGAGPIWELSLMEKIPSSMRRKWDEDACVTLFAYAPTTLKNVMLNYMMWSLAYPSYSLASVGRVNWYIFMHPSAYKRLYTPSQYKVKEKNTTAKDVVLPNLYDVKPCLNLRSSDFEPPETHSKKDTECGETEYAKDSLLLVKLTPRQDALENFQPGDIRLFHSLMMQVITKQNTRVIFHMEKLVPGCGLRLINLGFTMREEIWGISPDRWFTLYKAIQSWPEFKHSPLKQILDKQVDKEDKDKSDGSPDGTAEDEDRDTTPQLPGVDEDSENRLPSEAKQAL